MHVLYDYENAGHGVIIYLELFDSAKIRTSALRGGGSALCCMRHCKVYP
jgi:hypothetical protein